MDESKVFGDIRSLLHGRPSEESFDQLLRLLTLARRDETLWERVQPYCQEALEEWPDHCCTTPWRMLNPLMKKGTWREELRFCRQIKLVGRTNLRAQHFRQFCDRERLPLVRQIAFERLKLRYGTFKVLSDSAFCDELLVVRLIDVNTPKSTIRDLFQSEHFQQLRVLDLRRTVYDRELRDALEGLEESRALQTLDMRGARIGPEDMQALWSSEQLPELRELRLELTYRFRTEDLARLESGPMLSQLERLEVQSTKRAERSKLRKLKMLEPWRSSGLTFPI